MADLESAGSSALARTPLFELHLAHEARLVPFAGYEMPVQYSTGILKEHLFTRTHAGLFDVSHMGQIIVDAPGADLDSAALALESLIPADILGLAPGRQRYGLLTNVKGGIEDDLMIQNLGDRYLLVVNAATKDADEAHLRNRLPSSVSVTRLENALVALQGPAAETALSKFWRDCASMRFMDVREADLMGAPCVISRSGYTGEDGFEISMPNHIVADFAKALVARDDVALIGLGARDSLRLEAGLCLYGSDIDAKTTPIEAALAWAIPKARRTNGDRSAGFPGSNVILHQLENGPDRCRIGFRPVGKAPVRGGVQLFADETAREPIGNVTSGGFGPSVEGPIAMGYIQNALAKPGLRIYAEVRGKRLPVDTAQLPFVPHNYNKSTS